MNTPSQYHLADPQRACWRPSLRSRSPARSASAPSRPAPPRCLPTPSASRRRRSRASPTSSRRFRPAVVSVRVKAKIEPASDNGGADLFQGVPGLRPPSRRPSAEALLPRVPRRRRSGGGQRPRQQRRGGRRPSEPRPVAQGSGFFISEDGYLVTNNHVVDGGQTFTVVMDDGDELDAKLIGTDPTTDLAVLKVDDGAQVHLRRTSPTTARSASATGSSPSAIRSASAAR